MAMRSIDTGIWGEEGFARAGVVAKILFVRLFSGDDTGSAGALKTRPKRLAADLEGEVDDVSVEQVERALEQLREAGLVRIYADGWIWLPKFIHWQAHSEGFLKGAERQAGECPDSLARAIRRAVEKKRDLLNLRSDKSRTKKEAITREKSEGTPKGRGKAPRAIGSARGKGKGSGSKDLTPSSPTPSPPPTESAAAPPEPEPGAQSPPPEANGHGEPSRVDLDAIAAASPAIAAGLARARAGA